MMPRTLSTIHSGHQPISVPTSPKGSADLDAGTVWGFTDDMDMDTTRSQNTVGAKRRKKLNPLGLPNGAASTEVQSPEDLIDASFAEKRAAEEEVLGRVKFLEEKVVTGDNLNLEWQRLDQQSQVEASILKEQVFNLNKVINTNKNEFIAVRGVLLQTETSNKLLCDEKIQCGQEIESLKTSSVTNGDEIASLMVRIAQYENDEKIMNAKKIEDRVEIDLLKKYLKDKEEIIHTTLSRLADDNERHINELVLVVPNDEGIMGVDKTDTNGEESKTDNASVQTSTDDHQDTELEEETKVLRAAVNRAFYFQVFQEDEQGPTFCATSKAKLLPTEIVIQVSGSCKCNAFVKERLGMSMYKSFLNKEAFCCPSCDSPCVLAEYTTVQKSTHETVWRHIRDILETDTFSHVQAKYAKNQEARKKVERDLIAAPFREIIKNVQGVVATMCTDKTSNDQDMTMSD